MQKENVHDNSTDQKIGDKKNKTILITIVIIIFIGLIIFYLFFSDNQNEDEWNLQEEIKKLLIKQNKLLSLKNK